MNYGIKLRADESGQTLIAAAFGTAPIIGFSGLSVDLGQLRDTRRNSHLAADAAALAPNCSAMQAATRKSLPKNDMTGVTMVGNCAGPTASAILLAINGPGALGADRVSPPSESISFHNYLSNNDAVPVSSPLPAVDSDVLAQ